MEFKLFDQLHIFYLLGYSLVFVFLYFGVRYSSQPKKIIRAISLIILMIKCGELFIRYKLVGEAWYSLLPLHLCDIALVLAILGSVFRFSPFLYAIFFWSIGSIFALLVPEVKETFPHFFNVSFFSTHYYVIFIAIVEYTIFKLRPSFVSWLSSFLGINIIMAGVFSINKVLETNYLYINQKPTFHYLLDYFGEWPYYIIVVEAVYIILTLLLLFLFKKREYKIKINR